MDATKMEFENECFDVVLDKACIDAIFSSESEQCIESATRYLSEVLRVLKPDGILFTISMLQHFICKHLARKLFFDDCNY